MKHFFIGLPFKKVFDKIEDRKSSNTNQACLIFLIIFKMIR